MSIRFDLTSYTSFGKSKNFVNRNLQISDKIDKSSNLGKYIQENTRYLRQSVNQARRRLLMVQHSDNVTLMNFGQRTSVIHNNDTPQNIAKQIEEHIFQVKKDSKLNIL